MSAKRHLPQRLAQGLLKLNVRAAVRSIRNLRKINNEPVAPPVKVDGMWTMDWQEYYKACRRYDDALWQLSRHCPKWVIRLLSHYDVI